MELTYEDLKRLYIADELGVRVLPRSLELTYEDLKRGPLVLREMTSSAKRLELTYEDLKHIREPVSVNLRNIVGFGAYLRGFETRSGCAVIEPSDRRRSGLELTYEDLKFFPGFPQWAILGSNQ